MLTTGLLHLVIMEGVKVMVLIEEIGVMLGNKDYMENGMIMTEGRGTMMAINIFVVIELNDGDTIACVYHGTKFIVLPPA